MIEEREESRAHARSSALRAGGTDVLVLTIQLRPGMKYPSVNHQGADGMRFGRKSDDYQALAYDVEEAAKAAIEAIGWKPVEYPCRAWITRYTPDALVRDALNLGQCEANALTRAGVWTDDELARPFTLDYQPRSDGPDRVVIVVQRLAASAGAKPRAPRRKPIVAVGEVPAAGGGTTVITAVDGIARSWRPGDPIPDGYADLGGKLVPRDEALALIRGGRDDDKPRARRTR